MKILKEETQEFENTEEISVNPLKDAQEKAKKHQKGKGPFVKLDAGDVEHNTQAFNNAMGSNCEGGECMTENINKSKKIIKESRKTRLPAWSKESAVATLNSFSGNCILVQAQKAFEADNAIFTPVTWDDGAVVAKALSDDKIDVDVPQGAYCVIDHHTMQDFYYEVKVPAGCFVWDGRFWYYIEFSKEYDLCPDEIFGKDLYNELFTYFKDRANSADDLDDIAHLFDELDDVSGYIPYTINDEIYDFIENAYSEMEKATENSDNSDEEPIEESFENIADISDLIFDAYYGDKDVTELDVATPSDIDSYYKLIKNVHEAELFNYHSDYWGYDEEYQEQNIELIDALSPYINKMVKIEYEDGAIKGKLLGIAIDRQYNSISHTKVILDKIEDLETVTESIEEIEADEKKIEPQTINIRQALNELDKTIANSNLVNMYEAANLSLEDKQKLALMLAGQADANEIYDFLASKVGDGYLHRESHVTGDN